jgi:large subunit ribosomal protein L27
MLTRVSARLCGAASTTTSAVAAHSSCGGNSLLHAALRSSVPSTLGSWTPTPIASNLGGVRFATSKAGGSTKNGRDSKPKYLGVRRYGGHWVETGNIILLQRGQKYGIVESTHTVAFGKDWNIYALQPGYVHFWWHAMKRKYFVEVVRSCPGGDGQAISKYPIVRLKDWEVPELLKVPADTPISDSIRERLVSYLKTIPPARLGLVLPKDKNFVGGIEKEFYKQEEATRSQLEASLS